MIRFGLSFVVLLTLNTAAGTSAVPVQDLDDFERIEDWSTVAARGAHVSLARDRGRTGPALRIDFDFRKGGGEVLVHKHFPIALPENYALSFALRGSAPPNVLEVRLVDRSGKNVRRFRNPDFRFAKTWQTLRLKQRRFEFAWGPSGEKPLTELGLIEFVIARGSGGHGSVWIDDLRLEPLPPQGAYAGTPVLTASSSRPGQGPQRLLESPPGSAWHSADKGEPQWLLVDFGELREYGGLVIDWDPDDYATAYTIERSDDSRTWHKAYSVIRGNGRRDYIPLPESESRFVRFSLERSRQGKGFGIRRLEVAPIEFSSSSNRMFERIARDSERGAYPRYFLGEQTYWTVVGSSGTGRRGADREALLNEDGMLEVDEGAFSIEPFLYSGGRLHSWADGMATPSLERGFLPIPSVSRERGPLSLTVTALASDDPEGLVLARYRVTNRGAETAKASLFLTVRPFLVNPPWQSLHTMGGVAGIHRLGYENALLRADERLVVPLTRPAEAGVANFDAYPITSDLARDAVPSGKSVIDPNGFASGALRYPLVLAPGETRDVYLALPAKADHAGRDRFLDGAAAGRFWAKRYAEAVRKWESELGQVAFQVPPGDEDLVRAVKSNLAYILIHRDGRALRPGSRRYGRTWIRDGAITSATLLAFGHAQPVREFLHWYADYQTADGAVPCCLDPWGPDFMIEHDSAGQFIFTVANYYRFTGDHGFLKDLWPRVVRAVDYLADLRRQRLTEAYTRAETRRFFGLLPESASHEGYVARPVHSYWDDFWAIRGMADAGELAAAVGDREKAVRYAGLGDELRADVHRSIELTRRESGIDFVPASAELADYDPTSTAIALSIGGEALGDLEPALQQTFSRYARDVEARIKRELDQPAYAPYEFRNVGALVRLGKRDAAFRTLQFLFQGRRPAAWNQWPEIVWRDALAPRFIGDMPHSWIGAEFIQAFLSLFAYEESGQRLVLGAGLPRRWLEAAGGVGITGLKTSHGTLNYHVDAPAPGETRIRIDAGLTIPPGKLVVDLPLPQCPCRVELNGVAQSETDGRFVLRELPAEVIFRH
ncbi:discoidin domain-containing protein [Methylocaldum marinum]|uniref:discoidin domain-containing protein n=1 Tax=Methylocaldum marinum TaxID=1432792 RepID=UPI000E6A62AF|nr:discoidin domain-containing protein [Methylocaldum marinum]